MPDAGAERGQGAGSQRGGGPAVPCDGPPQPPGGLEGGEGGAYRGWRALLTEIEGPCSWTWGWETIMCHGLSMVTGRRNAV